MKRLLIKEVKPANDEDNPEPSCPYMELHKPLTWICGILSTGPECERVRCNDDECPLEKVSGSANRMLITEIDPAAIGFLADTSCPRRIHAGPGPGLKCSKLSTWDKSGPKMVVCNDSNCPLPKTEPGDIDET